MLAQIAISVIFFFILMYLSVNILGFLVRGLFSNPELERLKQEGHEFIKNEIKKSEQTNNLINIIAVILFIAYLYTLFHFWNIGVMIAALVIMAGRLPNLLWDIKHGRKTDPKLMKKDFLFYLSSILPWVAFPVLYYSLYFF